MMPLNLSVTGVVEGGGGEEKGKGQVNGDPMIIIMALMSEQFRSTSLSIERNSRRLPGASRLTALSLINGSHDHRPTKKPIDQVSQLANVFFCVCFLDQRAAWSPLSVFHDFHN